VERGPSAEEGSHFANSRNVRLVVSEVDMGETDVDCGGLCGATCQTGQGCASAMDCVSGNCSGGVCAEGNCNELTAADLGSSGSEHAVATNGCVMVRDGYPTWWGVRTMQLQTTTGNGYPIPIDWTNDCAASSGSTVFSGDWQGLFLGPTDSRCATVFNLDGPSGGSVTLRYY